MKKKSRNNVIRFTIFVIVFCMIFALVTQIFHLTEIDPYDVSISSTYAQFYNEPKDSIDVIAFGPSTIHSGFIPAALWEKKGIPSYNLAMVGSPTDIQYFWLKEALKYQSPAVVVVSASSLYREDDVNTKRERYIEGITNMRMSMNKLKFIKDIISRAKKHKKGRLLGYLAPLTLFHSRMDLGENDFNFRYLFERNPAMGSRTRLDMIPQERTDDFWDEDRADSLEIENEYLCKMVDVCHEKGIKVVMVDYPTNLNIMWSEKINHAMQEWADAHDIVFLDFNTKKLHKASGFDESTDFYDINHVNYLGAAKVSAYIGRYLADTYELPDRRTGDYDPHWDRVTEFFNVHQQYMLTHISLKQSTDFNEYLASLKKPSEFYVLISAIGDFNKGIDAKTKKSLQSLGLNAELFENPNNGAYWAMIDNGTVIAEEASEDKLNYKEYLQPENKYTSFAFKPLDVELTSSGLELISSVTINGAQVSLGNQGFNIIVYNKLSQRCIDSVSFDTSKKKFNMIRPELAKDQGG